MDTSKTRKEFILNMLLMKYPFLLQNLFPRREFRLTEQERNFAGMFIDIIGKELNTNVEIFVETQLSKSDGNHSQKINRLLDNIESGVVIWIATDFQQSHLEQFYRRLHFQQAKPIDFFYVRLDPNYIETLEELDKKTDKELWEIIEENRFLPPILTLERSILLIPDHYRAPETYLGDSLMTVKGANKYVLQTMKSRLPFFFNAHRSKDLKNRQIVFGAGITGLEYVLCLEDIYGNSYVRLRLTYPKANVPFIEMVEKIKASFPDTPVTQRRKDITLYLSTQGEKLARVNQLIDLFSDMYKATQQTT